MASDATVAKAVARTVQTSLRSRQWVVAFSGGLDSSVLLHALAHFEDLSVRAVYVDHGLQPEVRSRWRQHVEAAAEAIGISLKVLRVSVEVTAGSSVEAQARYARYEALANDLGAGEVLVTAQHADDQAETVLLQLLRGAGPAGLSAMPNLATFGQGLLSRPLLEVPKRAVQDYAGSHDLDWFEDPSNADLRFDRNYLRQQVMPEIEHRWPAVSQTLGRAARWQQAAASALARQALGDWQSACRPLQRVASCERLRQLHEPRAREALRAGILTAGLTVPGSARLQTILALVQAGSGRGLVDWEGGTARRYRDRLYFLQPLPPEPTGFDACWDGHLPLLLPQGYGAVNLYPEPAEPLALRCHFREQGLRVRQGSGLSKSFAQWCQERAIPPWARSRMPLLSCGDNLIAVGGKRLSGWHKLIGSPVPIWTDSPALGLSASPGSGIV